MPGFTIEEAKTVKGQLGQAQEYLTRTLDAHGPGDPVRAVVEKANGCIAEALRIFNENGDPERIRDALEPGDFSASREAANCVKIVRATCDTAIARKRAPKN